MPTSSRAAVEISGRTRYLLITAGHEAEEDMRPSYVAAAAPDRVETWTVDDAGHTEGLDVAPDEWTERVVTFLTDTLLAAAE